mgnify:CR=1 FL=1
MHIIGYTLLCLGIFVSAFSLIANVIGYKKKDKRWLKSARGGILSLLLIAGSAGFLLFCLLGTGQFQFKYVASYTNESLPLVYKLTAFWAGNEGSLLLWVILLCITAGMVIFSNHIQNQLIPYVSCVLLLNILFFFIVIFFTSNPFEVTDTIPIDGLGLNPMLQHPGMIFHPLAIFLGYVCLTVPFSFAVASLAANRADGEWIQLTRRWILASWLFLTIGNLLGGWWAYQELGWGGYWAWDPVENSSFLPWLTMTALLHSVMIQERKGMLRLWNMSLIIISYLLTLFGTFLVRSGILTSVHAFSDSGIGNYFLAFLFLMTVLSLYLLITRYEIIKKEANPIESYFSKESSFLLNNLILVASAFAVFWGTLYPLLSEVFTGTRVNVGPPYFNKVMAPIMLALIVLMAACPLIAWKKAHVKKFLRNFTWPLAAGLLSSCILFAAGLRGILAIIGLSCTVTMFASHVQEFVNGIRARRKVKKENVLLSSWKLLMKNRRRYGGYIVHIGVAFLALGVISSHAYSQEVLKTVQTGDNFSIGDYQLTFKGLTEVIENDKGIVAADVEIAYKGKYLGMVQPEKVFYETWPEPTSEVAIKEHRFQDIYVVLSSWESLNKATFQVKLNPFVSWIWSGGIIMMIGTLFSLIGGTRINNRVYKFSSSKAGEF